MSDWPDSDAVASEIHRAFALSVTYQPLSGPSKPIAAVYSNKPAPSFMGEGATLRTVKWQVLQADVAAPAKGDRIVGGAELPARLRGDWLVIDITVRDDVAAHDLIVERTNA
jgi:hypothetical protein